tara:strand:+ start:1467 stop:1715 length:249 start_codon:yes stop_codon:yes gene_type:complete
MTKYTRVVKHIEASFIRIMEREGVEEVNTRQIQADYNEHSRYGITTQRLTNLLQRRPQFSPIRTETIKGTNRQVTYWKLAEA